MWGAPLLWAGIFAAAFAVGRILRAHDRRQFRADAADLQRVRSLRNTEVDQYIRDGRRQQ